MIYTVKNVVVENNDLLYNDGVTKLFLYTEGKYGGSEKLKVLLKYMTSTRNRHIFKLGQYFQGNRLNKKQIKLD